MKFAGEMDAGERAFDFDSGQLALRLDLSLESCPWECTYECTAFGLGALGTSMSPRQGYRGPRTRSIIKRGGLSIEQLPSRHCLLHVGNACGYSTLPGPTGH